MVPGTRTSAVDPGSGEVGGGSSVSSHPMKAHLRSEEFGDQVKAPIGLVVILQKFPNRTFYCN